MPQFRTGNMLDHYTDDEMWLFTANSSHNSRGELVMGVGAAKAFKERFPQLPQQLGESITEGSLYGVVMVDNLGAFQTKVDWRNRSRLSIIEHSVRELTRWCEQLPGQRFNVNYPGIGFGGLLKHSVAPYVQQLPDQVVIWEL